MGKFIVLDVFLFLVFISAITAFVFSVGSLIFKKKRGVKK